MFRVVVLTAVLLPAISAKARLAWFHTPSGVVTHEFRDGRVVRQRNGLYIELSNETVRVRVETVRARAWDCNPDWRSGEPMEIETDRWNVARRLLVVRSGGVDVLLDATEIEANTWIDDRIRPIASLGPYLLVRRDYHYHAVCSVHGNGGRSWFWFDLRDGSRIEVETPPAALTELPERERRMRQRLREDVVADSDPSQAADVANFSGPAQGVGVEPRLRAGRWRARVHIELGVPYAWGQGATTYARDGYIDTDGSLGPRFASFERVPTYVRHFLNSRPQWKLGGVSPER